jgi:hypothetical protein
VNKSIIDSAETKAVSGMFLMVTRPVKMRIKAFVDGKWRLGWYEVGVNAARLDYVKFDNYKTGDEVKSWPKSKKRIF